MAMVYRRANAALDVLDEGKQDWDARRPDARQGAKYTDRRYWERVLTALHELVLVLPVPASWSGLRMMTNWKPMLGAAAGILAIVAKVVNGGSLDTEDIAIVSGLLGLLFAKQHNVTGGSKKQ